MRNRGWRHAGAAVALAVTLAGCGSTSAPSPPTGVDGLTIPTPSPDPTDFVARVDNPWLPLPVGARWEYGDPSAPRARLTAVAEEGPRIAGIATTTLVRTGARGRLTRDHYAQDRAGNVWWFGRAGEWRAGVDGAEAGLAMPAHPRVGDGFRSAPDVVSTVDDLDQEVEVPLASYDHTVVLEVDEGGVTREDVYARGVGLVRTGRAGLVAYDEPRSEG